MRIRELQIDGFAALNGVNVPVDAPLTVIAGPNEAGKSSIHRFIRSMLYGYANRGQPVERGEPINGGRHGGRLLLSDGLRDYVLERYGDVPNRRGGQAVSLRDPDGIERPLAQAELERLWLGGVSEKLFRQLFAVTLDELHELRALQGEEVGNYLYHAGMAGGASLTSAIKTISSEMEKLYKPKGELPELNKLLEELKEAEAALRQSRKGIGPYNEAVMELKAVVRELSKTEELLPAKRRELALAQSAADAREDWLRIEALRMEEAELARELPNPEADPLPEHAEVKWESLVSNRAAEQARLQGVLDEKERLGAERMSLNWQEELVRRLPELEALEARRESVAARREERAELAADIRLLDESIALQLGRLSADWQEADLQAFASLSERERARRLQAALEEAERKLEKTLDELGRLDRQIELRLEEEREPERQAEERRLAASAALELLPRTKKELLAAWNELEDARRAWERAEWEMKLAREAVLALTAFGAEGKSGEETLSTRTGGLSRQTGRRTEAERQGRGGMRKRLSAAAIALAAAAVGLPFAAGKPAGEAAGYYLLGALLAALAVYAAWPKGASRPIARPGAPEASSDASLEARRKLSEAQSRSRESELRFEAAAAALFARAGAMEVPDDASWQKMRMAVQERVGQLELEEREQEALQERERHLASLRRERERLERDRDADLLRCETERNRWSAWLEARKLSQGLPPELLPELFQLAEQVLQAYRQRARAQERAAQLFSGEEEFEAAAAELFAVCPPPAAAGGDTLLAVKLLHAEALRQRELAAEASRLDERLKQASAAFEAAREAVAALDAAVRAALDAAGEADEAAYERRLRADERRRRLRSERREAELRLAAGRDATGLAELKARLARSDEAALRLELAQALEALREQERLRSELLERRGRLAQQLERLRAEAETDDRVVSIEERQAELARLAERYAVLAICGELIRRTKTVFEQDKQPLVLHKASRYFSILTAGAYVRIVAPGDAPVLLAETGDRKVVDSSFLSRGTREQLYLALRFALAGAASPEQELPLLLDDLFVHFDDVRLKQAAEVLTEVSAQRQVILFTCHEHVAKKMAEGVPGSLLVRMEGRTAALAEAGRPSP